jgi:uncharacterized protein YdhG (YjbR/CyaY superfamily)
VRGTSQGLSVPFLNMDERSQDDSGGGGKQDGLGPLQAGGGLVFLHMPEHVDDARGWQQESLRQQGNVLLAAAVAEEAHVVDSVLAWSSVDARLLSVSVFPLTFSYFPISQNSPILDEDASSATKQNNHSPESRESTVKFPPFQTPF